VQSNQLSQRKSSKQGCSFKWSATFKCGEVFKGNERLGRAPASRLPIARQVTVAPDLVSVESNKPSPEVSQTAYACCDPTACLEITALAPESKCTKMRTWLIADSPSRCSGCSKCGASRLSRRTPQPIRPGIIGKSAVSKKCANFQAKPHGLWGCRQFTVCGMTCGCASRLRRAPTFCLRSNWGRPRPAPENERF
jgi:hypothetical protein